MRVAALFVAMLSLAATLWAKPCPRCGTENDELAKFCKSGCGYEFVEQEVEQEEPDPATILLRANEAYAEGRWDEALRIYEALLKKDPENALAKVRIPDCERRVSELRRQRQAEERAREEVRVFEHWLRQASEQRQYRLATARGLVDEGKLVEAATYTLLALAPDWSWHEGRSLLCDIAEKSNWSHGIDQAAGVFADAPIASRFREQLQQSALSLCLEMISGLVKVDVSNEHARVLVDSVFVGLTPVEQRLGVGRHAIVVELEGYYAVRESLEVAPGDTVRLTFDLTPLFGHAVFLSHPEGAAVQVNGLLKGITPLGPIRLQGGRKNLSLVRKGYEPWGGVFEVGEGDTVSVYGDLARKSAGKAFIRSLVIPGSGQRYRDRGTMGAFYTLAEMAAIVVSVRSYVSYNDAVDEYDRAKSAYDRATSGYEPLWNSMNVKYEAANRKRKDYNLAISLAGVVYAVNLIDCVLF
ncbi:PEGA domain-containing protein [Candidatus Fermentibacteria bacterium]|nr:PEGA domain-containing protein [Candidatus Fermentibacteria bacterium]